MPDHSKSDYFMDCVKLYVQASTEHQQSLTPNHDTSCHWKKHCPFLLHQGDIHVWKAKAKQSLKCVKFHFQWIPVLFLHYICCLPTPLVPVVLCFNNYDKPDSHHTHTIYTVIVHAGYPSTSSVGKTFFAFLVHAELMIFFCNWQEAQGMPSSWQPTLCLTCTDNHAWCIWLERWQQRNSKEYS